MYYLLAFAKWCRKIVIYKILRRRTRGVRIILKDDSKVFLVKHPYDNFWVFPGGGIDKYESPEQAARREVIEETPYKMVGEMKILGTYNNTSGGKHDTVTVFVAEKYTEARQKHALIDTLEIQKSGWFEISNLPATSRATQTRISELFSQNYSDKIRTW